VSIEIERPVLEKACMEMIETILFCLPNAFKGTIYRVGKPPGLIAERITSGMITDEGRKISWGLPATVSLCRFLIELDSNPPLRSLFGLFRSIPAGPWPHIITMPIHKFSV